MQERWTTSDFLTSQSLSLTTLNTSETYQEQIISTETSFAQKQKFTTFFYEEMYEIGHVVKFSIMQNGLVISRAVIRPIKKSDLKNSHSFQDFDCHTSSM